MTKIMITGVNGFVGKHLATELKSRGYTVIGVGREPELHDTLNGLLDEYYTCDLTKPEDVERLPLNDINAVINLAGLAAIGASFGQEELYMRINVAVLTVIGERILKLGLKSRVIAVSTGAVYAAGQPLPLNEASEIITTGSPYALSKIAMEKEASRLRASGLECVIARPFNHIGPGQETGFLLPDLYEKMIKALKGDDLVKVGDLTTRRDYTDVRDVVKAYADLALAEKLDEEIYNICSGRSLPGSTIFDLLASCIENSKKIKTEVDRQLLRPNDPKDLYGDNTKLKAQTGWSPKFPIEKSVQDFVDSKKEQI